MSSKRKCQPVDTASEASNNPIDKCIILNLSKMNYSDAVAVVLTASLYYFKNFYETQVTPNKKLKKELNILIKKLIILSDNISHSNDIQVKNDTISLAKAYFFIAHMYISPGEWNVLKSYQLFTRATKLLDRYEIQPETFMLTLRLYRSRGHMLNSLEKFAEAIEIYESALKICKICMEKIDLNTIFPDVAMKGEENINISNKLQLIYNAFLVDLIALYNLEKFRKLYKYKALMYEHMLIEKCLQSSVNDDIFRYDVILISLSAAQKLIAFDCFKQAKDFIAAAHYILMKFSGNSNLKNNYLKSITDIYFMWAYYGIRLLMVSKKRLFTESEKRSDEQNVKSIALPEEIQLSSLLFANMKNHLKKYTELIADTEFLSDYDSAKKVFAYVLILIYRASLFGTKIENIYLRTMLYLAEAYHHYAFYELKSQTQLKIHLERDICLNNITEILINKDVSATQTLLKIIRLKNIIFLSTIYDISDELNDIMLIEEFSMAYYISMKEIMTSTATACIKCFKSYLSLIE